MSSIGSGQAFSRLQMRFSKPLETHFLRSITCVQAPGCIGLRLNPVASPTGAVPSGAFEDSGSTASPNHVAAFGSQTASPIKRTNIAPEPTKNRRVTRRVPPRRRQMKSNAIWFIENRSLKAVWTHSVVNRGCLQFPRLTCERAHGAAQFPNYCRPVSAS
jgi:hypothetical protein